MCSLWHMPHFGPEQGITMPKGEAEGILAFVVPTGQHHAALNGVNHDVGQPRPAEDLGPHARMVLVARDGGRLPSTGMGMSAMLCL